VNIALIKLSSIGDVIHTLPLAMQLKQKFPDARLEWIVQEEPAPLLRNHPGVDGLRIYPRRGGLKAVIAFLGDLYRARKYDLAVDAQGNAKSGLVTCATRAGTRLGFHRKNCREGLNRLATNRVLPYLSSGHVIDHYLALGRELGCGETWPGFGLAFGSEEKSTVRTDLQGWGVSLAAPTACFNIRPQADVREWYADRYAALADRLCQEAGYQVILNAGPAHQEDAARVAERTRSEGVINLAGKNDIRELGIQYQLLAEEGRGRNFFFGCDSAPLHLAVAVGLPAVGLYGSQDPARNGPYGGPSLAIEGMPDLPCGYCRKRVCRLKEEDRACMARISVEQVWNLLQPGIQDGTWGKPESAQL
jgi:ADP-heptose:LPS heptosyltransferase